MMMMKVVLVVEQLEISSQFRATAEISIPATPSPFGCDDYSSLGINLMIKDKAAREKLASHCPHLSDFVS